MVAHRRQQLARLQQDHRRGRPDGPGRPVPSRAMLRLFDTAKGGVVPFEPREPGQGVDVRVRADRLRPAAPRPRPVLARVRRAAPLPRVGGPRGHLRLEHHRHRRQHHQPRPSRGARPRPRSPREYEAVWWEAMDAIGVQRPTIDPHATAYVEQMVELVARLVDFGDRLRDERRRVLPGRADRGLRAAGPPVARLAAGRRPGRGERREAVADRLRALEEGQAGEPSWPSPWGDGPARAGTPSAW